MSSITLKFEGVPADLVLQIAQQLAATHTAGPVLVSDEPGQPEVNAEPAGPTEAESQAALINGWMPEKLLPYHADSTDPQRGVLDYLAANPETWVGSSELVDNVAEINSYKSIPGIVGGLNRRARRYGASNSPVEWRKIEGLWHQRMPAAVADVIREAAE